MVGSALTIKANCRALLPEAKRKVPVVTVKNDLVLKALIEKNLGMALLPEEIIKEELATGKIIQLLPKKSDAVTLTIDVAYKKRRTHSYLHESFLKFITSQLNLWI